MSRDLDRTFSSHYALLKEYLASYVVSGRTASKDKLSRLPPEQLLDVSTDLYDEISRRIKDSKEGTALLSSLVV